MSANNLKESRAELLARRDLKGLDWCAEWSRQVDGWLASLFDSAAPDSGGGVALVAVGSYGRGTLAPGSDLDLVLIHDGKHKRIKDVADAIWYPIWDSGQPLDHSVRTVKELRSAMDADIKVALGLLDARLIAGDPALGPSALARAAELWQTRTTKWLQFRNKR